VRREPGERGENGRCSPGSQLGHRYQTRGNGPTRPGRPFLARINHAPREASGLTRKAAATAEPPIMQGLPAECLHTWAFARATSYTDHSIYLLVYIVQDRYLHRAAQISKHIMLVSRLYHNICPYPMILFSLVVFPLLSTLHLLIF
jgi:hypothetical protein